MLDAIKQHCLHISSKSNGNRLIVLQISIKTHGNHSFYMQLSNIVADFLNENCSFIRILMKSYGNHANLMLSEEGV